MGIIHILDTEVSNKIAAGEVVERPLSVVKELVENSIDAGATSITVEIRGGGAEYVRVTDNGCGMSHDDAKICFLRHATSKIATGDDLDAIYTLGFRGEALSSIGAVAKVKIYTKRREDTDGVCVSCEGGEILSSDASGVPDGTIIEVCDLFYNTPARKKFLKKAATEGGYISDIISRFVFAHPEISFKLIRDGKEIIFSAGDNKLINTVYAIYGKDYAKNMLEVDYEYNGIHIVGVIGKGTLSRANRNYQTFLVNKRYVKSALMIKALEEAYKNQIMISKFPTAILNIELPADKVDINVHPTKLECKFEDEQIIYQAVYHSVKSALYALPNIPEIERKCENVGTDRVEEKPSKSLEDIFREKLREAEIKKERMFTPQRAEQIVMPSNTNQTRQEQTAIPSDEQPVNQPEISQSANDKIQFASENTLMSDERIGNSKIDAFSMIDFAMEHSKKNKEGLDVKSPSASGGEKRENIDWREYLKNMRTDEEKSEKSYFKGDFRVIGQLFDTYILIEKDDAMLMIDQHAAHERLNYEALKVEIEQSGVTSQMMIEPITVHMQPSELTVYLENKDLFSQLGFDISVTKDGDVEIAAGPGDVSYSSIEPLFLELLTQAEEMKQQVIGAKKLRLLYTISCKASIKANMKMSELEMTRLAQRVFNLKNINTCPHGRPIVIAMTKKEIEKNFKRIV